MAAEGQDTDRVAVKTYVPAYQRDEWDEHADDLDMSRSEFVRSMVQAGRRGFDPRGDGPETTFDENGAPAPEEPIDDEQNQKSEIESGGEFDETVLALLDDDCLSWEELFEELTDDVESRLDETLQRLQAENEIQHSGRQGGYVRVQ